VDDEVVLPDADLEDAPQVFVHGTKLGAVFPARSLLRSAPLVISESPVAVSAVKLGNSIPILSGDYATGLVDESSHGDRISRTAEQVSVAANRESVNDLGAGALLHAALAAQERIATYRAERGFNTSATPLPSFSRALHVAAFGPDPSSAAVVAQSSPVRLNGEGQFTCVPGPAGYVLTWKPSVPGGVLQLASPLRFDLNEAKGVAKLDPKPGKEWFIVSLTPLAAELQVTLTLPPGKEIPKKA
jgi:hypothetical protein